MISSNFGFVDAARELSIQMSEKELSFDRIVFASSSGGTHAGLIAGAEIYGLNSELTGISIDKEGLDEGTFAKLILDLANETALRLNISKVFTDKEILLKNGYTGDGYRINSVTFFSKRFCFQQIVLHYTLPKMVKTSIAN